MVVHRIAAAGPARSETRRALATLLVLLPVAWLVPGCARRSSPPAAERTQVAPLAVQVYADTGRGERLQVRLPAARIWLAHVTPTRLPLPQPPPPEAQPESLPAFDAPAPALDVDPGLKPPVLRTPARLTLPAGGRRPGGLVELDVRVDEAGGVSDALWVAGSPDTALLEAARRCALAMRFYPALRAGRPAAVWCRQRFDFRAAGAVRGAAPAGTTPTVR